MKSQTQRIMLIVLWTAATSILSSCGREATWPPALQTAQERRIVEAALRAVDQVDGWAQVAWVVEKRAGEWKVQAWKIVNPGAKGRDQCVPWAVRGIKLDEDAKVTAYENHL